MSATRTVHSSAEYSDHATGQFDQVDGDRYYKISNSHLMPEFFMSLVGASDHWMFVSSLGGLTAGRCDPDTALFPYAPDDQISDARDSSGPITLIRNCSSSPAGASTVWQPYAVNDAASHTCHRNLYKTPLGNKLIFEEVNQTLQLRFRYRWAFSEQYGFVRTCSLTNQSSSPCAFDLLDGLQNVLPFGVGSDFVTRFSNLGNAYKKSELLAASELGIFYMSSIPTDRAEPSEGLKATTVWQSGLQPDHVLLSTHQLSGFRAGASLNSEQNIRGKAGAYLISKAIALEPGEEIQWDVVAELAQDHVSVVATDRWLRKTKCVSQDVAESIDQGEQDLLRIASSSDGLQCSGNQRRANRHLSSTIFNVMRGGVPLDNYQVRSDDFRRHVAQFNRTVSERNQAQLDGLPASMNAAELLEQFSATDDADIVRLAMEYLPLAFSRRHGDPTRPWNRFAIQLRSASGQVNLDYQGNWRDIFQNWEALGLSFPKFSTAMISRFLNATTADGYNPYRLTKSGFEWEEPTPEDPWANIGYWGDHQIVYLLKLLEWNRRLEPAALNQLLNSPLFVHANIPYCIKGFDATCLDPQDTIEFDEARGRSIEQRVAAIGADGKLLREQSGEIHHVTLVEKLLTLSLAKLTNFVPDGGIWLNTQRPEWNDANNALVGNGLSMVTACYLHRWFDFLFDWLGSCDDAAFQVSEEVADLLQAAASVLAKFAPVEGELTPAGTRYEIVSALSRAGESYRTQLYSKGPSGEQRSIPKHDCLEFFQSARDHLRTSIANNRRSDGLFHSYNLIDIHDGHVAVDHLYEMLEGQVAVLSSGLLDADAAVKLLDALRKSSLYRKNQQSYLLYPDRQLPGFLEKNRIAPELIDRNPLLGRLLGDESVSIVSKDVLGEAHFCGSFRNASDLRTALDELGADYAADVAADAGQLAAIFEDVFGHRQFTGRSGTFFGYEGLGSIYWHMVSKLWLATQEHFFAAVQSKADTQTTEALREHFQQIRQGIGGEKCPSNYGAFPSDPYSHTPEDAGVKQPGMTGQVKEDILTRLAEIGVHIVDGCLRFRLDLFDRSELCSQAQEFGYYNVFGKRQTITVPEQGFAFTLCQVPIVYQAGTADRIEVRFADGSTTSSPARQLDQATSQKLFSRRGDIVSIDCQFQL